MSRPPTGPFPVARLDGSKLAQATLAELLEAFRSASPEGRRAIVEAARKIRAAEVRREKAAEGEG